MELNSRIFSVTNPARTLDALWNIIVADGGMENMADMLIFLPSRRAVRSVEKMIAEKMGGAAILPRLVGLGEAADPFDLDDEFDAAGDDVASNMMRVCVAAKLLAADANIRNVGTALPIARDLVRMTDYLENEGVDASEIDWASLVDEKYAAHFSAKARMLNILSRIMPACVGAKMTVAAKKNSDIRAWIDVIKKEKFSRVIVCGSTASVPATSDLMAAVAGADNGRIILSGRIAGQENEFALDTHPYNAEHKFLSRIGMCPADVIPIDVGPSNMDFFNRAFGNNIMAGVTDLNNCHLIECNREAEEAAAAAEVAARAAAMGQSVLIITPDAAANQRIAAAFAARGLDADFSGGLSGASIPAARAILNLFDDWASAGTDVFDKRYAASGHNLFNLIADLVENCRDIMAPAFNVDDVENTPIWVALKELSDCISTAGIELTVSDARAFIADCFASVSIRPPMKDGAKIAVLGTIESRMQTADVVILTGLNEAMFPARGYENAWLPRFVARTVGLPSPDRKVSLMALDFMNLSCGKSVYWMRSKMSGGVQATESRFLSRVTAHGGRPDLSVGADVLASVRAADAPHPAPLLLGRAVPPADWSDVYVTELELLIHNPYAFYAKHILRLSPKDDWWVGPDARTFGTLVHNVLEVATDWRPDVLVAQMDAAAVEKVGHGSVLFHFWHKRFLEIAPLASQVLGSMRGATEIAGAVRIPVGTGYRCVRARADRIWPGGVLDIKTGAAPSKKQLEEGNMPQLPLEAYMLQTGGFNVPYRTDAPVMMFLQLRNGDTRAIEYDAEQTASMIAAALDKVVALFNQYSAGGAEYEYRMTNDKKYRAYDDLARIDD